MGLGQVGWGAGRLLGFKALAAAGGEGPLALWAGRALGIVAEGSAWTAALQAGRALGQGEKKPDGFTAMAREWVANCTMAASLRSAQGIFAQTGPWGLALGTFAGLVISDRGLALSGITPSKTFSQTLTQSLILFGSMQGAGLLAQGLWGTRLAQMDQIFTAKFHQIQTSRSARGGFPGAWGGEVWEGPGTVALQAEALAGSLNKPWAIGKDPKDLPVESPGRYRTSPQSGSRDKTPEGEGSFDRPWRLERIEELTRQLQDPRSPFFSRILEDHTYFCLPSLKDFSSSEFHATLDGLKNIDKIRGGRKIQFRFEDDAARFDYIKFGSSFRMKEGKSSISSYPPDSRMKRVSPVAATFNETTRTLVQVQSRMDQVAARRHTPAPFASPVKAKQTQPVTSTDPATPKAKSNPPLQLVLDSKELIGFFRGLVGATPGKFHGETMVNRAEPVPTSDLLEMSEILKTTPEGSSFKIHDPQRRRTFHMTYEINGVRTLPIFWERPVFELLQADTFLEVLQHFSFLRTLSPSGKVPLPLEFRGEWRSHKEGRELEAFLNVQLPNGFRPLHIRQGPHRQEFRFEANPAGGRWVKAPWE
jgi:hypothetical protein